MWPSELVVCVLSLYAFLLLSTFWVFAARKSIALREKIMAWWIFLPAVTFALLFTAAAGWALCAIILCLGVREVASHLRADQGHPRLSDLLLCAALCITIVWVVWFFTWVGVLVFALAFAAICWLFGHPHQHTRRRAALCALVLLSSGMAFLPKLQAQLVDDGRWVLWLCAVTALCDVAQYIAGTTMGKRQVTPSASPGKTWAGWFGGLVVAVCASLALGGALSLATWALLLAYGVAIAVSGFMGDVSFSACKRMLGIKDFSSRVPGHGGVLDRVDSLTFTAPTIFILTFFQSASV